MEEFSDLDEETGINIANMNEIDFSSENMITPIEENEIANYNCDNNENIVNINLNNINVRKRFAEELEPYLYNNANNLILPPSISSISLSNFCKSLLV